MPTTNVPERTTENHDDCRTTMPPVLLTIPEVAAALAVGRTTVYGLITAGEIDVVHIGRSSRVPADAIHAFVAAKRAQD